MNQLNNQNCGGPFPASDVQVASCWEHLPTTKEEMAILKYHAIHPDFFYEKNILHIGLGNVELVHELSKTANHIDSITISQAEINHAQSNYKLPNTRFFLINKYNLSELDQLKATYDIIIDVNLKSFACCEDHFQEMMHFFIDKLTPQGQIISALSGIEFGWNGNVKRSYTPGSSTEKLSENFRILGKEGVKLICAKHKLKRSTYLVEDILHHHGTNPKLLPNGKVEKEQLYFLSK